MNLRALLVASVLLLVLVPNAVAASQVTARGVALNAGANCDNANLDITLTSHDAEREYGRTSRSDGTELYSFEQSSGLANFDGTFYGYGMPVGSTQDDGTVIGSYAYEGTTPPDPTTTGEFFVLYRCHASSAPEVLQTCYGVYGTCPETALEALNGGPSPGLANPKLANNPDGTCTAYNDANGNGQVDPGEAYATVPCSVPQGSTPNPKVAVNPDGTCTLYDDKDNDGQVDPSEAIETVPCLHPAVQQNPDGSTTIYDDRNGNGQVDAGETILVVPNASVADADGDNVPDAVESQLCGRPITHDFINGHGPTAGQCVSTTNYVPPTATETLLVPTGLQVGADADGDGVPATLTIHQVAVTVRPFSQPAVTEASAPDSVQTVDSNDNDPNVPILSVVTLPAPIPSGVAFGPDNDRDGVPSTLIVLQSTVTFDRRSVLNPVTFGPAASQSEPLDTNDNDPNAPVVSVVGPVSVPIGASHGADNDKDDVPASVTISFLDVTVDRRNANPISTSTHTTTITLDPNDGDRGAPVPLSAIDADADSVPDAIEPFLCEVQDQNTLSDGHCGTPDGSNLNDYTPPAGVPDPWDLA